MPGPQAIRIRTLPLSIAPSCLDTVVCSSTTSETIPIMLTDPNLYRFIQLSPKQDTQSVI